MQYPYFICDVFTTARFGGNQLAVVPRAEGLTQDQMHGIAREFNFSETTFVFPRGSPLARRLRIFTPTLEVPFAGHPNVGTAFALAHAGEFGAIGDGIVVAFEQTAGAVPVTIRHDEASRIWCEIGAPEPLSVSTDVDPECVARALSLVPRDIRTATHSPCVASVGLPFVIAEMANLEALQRIRTNIQELESMRSRGLPPDIHAYVRHEGESEIRARMFAPLDNVPEDPATGSANAALAALLASSGVEPPAGDAWQVIQGVEMGRPSKIMVRTRRRDNDIMAWIGGNSVMVGEGSIIVG